MYFSKPRTFCSFPLTFLSSLRTSLALLIFFRLLAPELDFLYPPLRVSLYNGRPRLNNTLSPSFLAFEASRYHKQKGLG